MKTFMVKYLGSLGLIVITVVTLAGSSAVAAANNATQTTSQPSTAAERITERKNTLKLQISTAQSQKIVSKCAAAQKLIKSITAEDNNSANKRKLVYTNISTRLAKVIDGLNKQSIESTQLKTLQAQFNDTANQYLIDASTYKMTMEDLSEMNCSADPAGFMATLTSARQLRVKLASEVGQVASVKNSLVQAMATATAAFNTPKTQENQ
jgi:hypothetical protein